MVENELQALADDYINIHKTIMGIGTDEMQTLSRLLLWEIGRQLARQIDDDTDSVEGD